MAQKTLSVKLSLNDKQFQSSLRKATRRMKKFGQSMKRTGQTLSRNLTLPLLAFGAASIAAFDKQQKAIAQVEAGLKSTGETVGFTSKQLQQMAADLQKRTLFGDEEILKDSTAQLLTFTNIAGEQFERTQVAALNLATRLDGDLKSASIQLGKALNDPIANLSALSRSGIQFSEEQKKIIKELAETNRLAEAQTIILDELEKQYGGSAEAAAKAGAGGLKQLQNQFGDLMEEIGGMLLPIVIDLGNQFKTFLEGFAKLNPEVKKMIVTAGILAGALGPLLVVLGSLVTIVATLSFKFIAIGAAIAALALGILYVNDNWEAFKERFSDISWWRNAIIDMISFLIEYNPFSALVEGFNFLLKQLGLEQFKADNLFIDLADSIKDLRVETKEYKNDFQDFGTFIENQGKKIKKALKGLGESFGVGTPGGGKVTTKKTNLGPVVSDPTPFDPLKNILDSVNFINQEESLITIPLFKKGYSIEVDEFSNLMGNIKSISDELNQSFQSFGNVFQSVFAQALQSQEGFFKSFVEGTKRALNALASQIASMLILNALLGGTSLGNLLGFKNIGGFGGIGQVISGVGSVDANSVGVGGSLRSMMNNGSGVEVFGTLRGADIILSSDRARNNRNRTRGY